MRKLVLVALVVLMTSVAFGADITLKDVPAGISEAQCREWVSILVERMENQKVNQIPEVTAAVKSAQTNIDSFRKANALTEKFKVVEPKEPNTGE